MKAPVVNDTIGSPESSPSSSGTTLRVGVVSYLNMQPLIHRLEQQAGEIFTLHHAPPSQLALALEREEIDIGMVPVASIFTHPQWRVLPCGMIGSNNQVRSVLIVGQQLPEHWRVLHPDSHSMTSNALARIITDARCPQAPEQGRPLPLDAEALPSSEEDEAWVLIGDRALRWMHPQAPAAPFALDLGEAWRTLTGLPFVFALWAVRPGVDTSRLEPILRDTLARNLDDLDTCIANLPAKNLDGQNPAEALDYFENNISYRFSDDARRGLEAFYQAGQLKGLFPAGWQLQLI